jgi:hypothetical protein
MFRLLVMSDVGAGAWPLPAGGKVCESIPFMEKVEFKTSPVSLVV